MRYFFDVDADDPPYVDEYGIELVSAEEARMEAFGLANALMRDRMDFRDDWSMTIQVSDVDRRPVYDLRLSMSGRALDGSEGEAAT